MLKYILFAIFYIGGSVFHVFAAVDSPVQSPARPFGLDIIDTVKVRASDTQSRAFQENYLPTFSQWARKDLGEQTLINQSAVISLDPSKLSLATQSDARVYFVSERTGYHNTLGFNTEGGTITAGNPSLIFPDASESKFRRRTRYPLRSGDFVNLGTQNAGTQLDFFLIANGARRGTNVYSTQNSVNPDGLSFASAYAVQDSPYLLIGFKDMNRSNRDYNDLVFALDIGVQNVVALANVPEPSTLVMLGALLSAAGFMTRGRKK